MTQEQTLGKLLHKLPGVEKVFKEVYIHIPGDTAYPLKASLPCINKECWGFTKAAYNLKVMAYNKKVSIANREVKKQVLAGKKWLDQQPKEKIGNILLTQAGFSNNNKNLFTKEYNDKATAYNTKYGSPIIPFRKYQSIKQTTEKVFDTFLWEYNKQLRALGNQRKAIGKVWQGPLQKMEVNTKHLENATGMHGIKMLHYCPDTILNHKNRLIEAGILINSQFRSSKRGTLHHISPQILVVFDNYDQKIICSENQLLRIAKPEVFRDAFITTRTISKTIVKRAVDNSTPHDKDKPEKGLHNAYPTDSSTRTPSGKMRKPKLESGAQKGKPGQNFSQKLEASLQNMPDLAKELSEHTTADTLISVDDLQKEAGSGSMSNENYRKLLLQQLFRHFSNLYMAHPDLKYIFPALWVKMLTAWSASKLFCTKNGELLKKDTMLLQYREFLYTIENSQWGAMTFVRSGKFIPPNPKIYLNPFSATPGTFLYHFNQVRTKSPKKFVAIRKTVSSLKSEAKNAKNYTNYLERLNREFAKYYNKRKSFQELMQYIKNNMPKEIQENFNTHFHNYTNNLNQRKL